MDIDIFVVVILYYDYFYNYFCCHWLFNLNTLGLRYWEGGDGGVRWQIL